MYLRQIHSLKNKNKMEICDLPPSLRKNAFKAFHATPQPNILFFPPSRASHSPEFCANYSLLMFRVFITHVFISNQ